VAQRHPRVRYQFQAQSWRRDRLTMTDEVIHEGYYLQSQNGPIPVRLSRNMVLYGPANDVMWMSSTTGMGKPPHVVYAHWRTLLKIVYLYD
jgi:hypothetical protein